jgi:hypothetical protein
MASTARLRVITINQVATLPRRGSNVSACRHARRKASCARSSARRASRVMASAMPYTRLWNRAMKVSAAPASPTEKPARSASSVSLHT